MNINATLIVEMLTFLVFVWFTMKFVWPMLTTALEKRRALITDGLAAADKGQQALDIAKKEGEALVAKARDQAAAILRQAEERAQSVADQAIADGKRQADLIVTQAHQELEAQLKAAKRELYNEVAGLALKAAGKVVMEDLDDEKHHKMVNTLVKSWS